MLSSSSSSSHGSLSLESGVVISKEVFKVSNSDETKAGCALPVGNLIGFKPDDDACGILLTAAGIVFDFQQDQISFFHVAHARLTEVLTASAARLALGIQHLFELVKLNRHNGRHLSG